MEITLVDSSRVNLADFDIDILVPLAKAHTSEDGGDRRVYGEASNENIDLAGDIVKASGLQQSLDFWKTYGKIDWDHKSLVHPQFLLGEPTEAGIEKGKCMIEGKLYKGPGMNMADTVWNLLKAKAKLGLSIGGKILKAKKVFDNELKRSVNQIEGVLFNHLAITPYPVNPATFIGTTPVVAFDSLAKSMAGCKGQDAIRGFLSAAAERVAKKDNDEDDANKALSTAPGSGSVMIPESLEGTQKTTTCKSTTGIENVEKAMREMIVMIAKSQMNDVKAEEVVGFMKGRFGLTSSETDILANFWVDNPDQIAKAIKLIRGTS